MTTKEAQSLVNEFLRQTLKPGDTVEHYMGSQLNVVRVNKRTITSDFGNLFPFSEIHTGETMKADVKAWYDARNAEAAK